MEQVDNEPLFPNGTEAIVGLSILLSVMQFFVTHAECLSVDPVDLRLHLPELDFGTGNMQWVKLALSRFMLNMQPTNKN